jgi:peroxiredoxin
VVALVVVSLAVPAAVLALILSRDHKPSGSTASDPAVVTPGKARVGEAAPDFALPDLDGRKVTLSEFRGRATVLTFFASWCYPCEQDMPVLERAQRDHGDKIAVVGVNYRDFPDDTRAFVQRLGVTFPILVEDPTDNPVAARYDVHEMPDTLFVDAHGVVRARLWGQTSRKDIDHALSSLLAAS